MLPGQVPMMHARQDLLVAFIAWRKGVGPFISLNSLRESKDAVGTFKPDDEPQGWLARQGRSAWVARPPYASMASSGNRMNSASLPISVPRSYRLEA